MNEHTNSNDEDWEARVDEHGTSIPITKLDDDFEAQNGLELDKVVISTTAEGAPTGRTRTILFVGLALAMFVGSLNSTVIAPALPIIAADLNGVENLTWVPTAYLLTFNATQPIYGKLSDIFGRKAILLTCMIIFTIASVGCALSVSMTMLIFMRAIQGLGGGGLISSVLIIIADIFPIDQRPRYQAIATSMFGLASVVGPLMGGALVDRLNWRWAFWITPIFAAPALIVVTFFFHLKHQRGSTLEKLKRVDFLGTFFEITGITCLMLGITWGGTKYAWNSAPIISLLIIAILLLSVFIYIEGYQAAEPVIPFRLFKKVSVVASFVSNFFVGMNFLGLLYFYPWLAEIAYNTDATQSGIRLIPLMISMVLASIVSGALVAKVGRINQYIVLGNMLSVVGFGLIYTLNESSSLGSQIGFLIIGGAGLGLAQMTIVAVQGAAETRDIASATALCQFMNTMGGSIGLAIFSSLFSNELTAHLVALPPTTLAEATAYNFSSSFLAIGKLPDDIRFPVEDAYVQSLRYMWFACIFIAGAAFIASLFIRTPRMTELVRQRKEATATEEAAAKEAAMEKEAAAEKSDL